MLRGLTFVLLSATAFGSSGDCPFSTVSVRGRVTGWIAQGDTVLVELKVTGHEKPERQSLTLGPSEFSANVRYWTVSREGHEIGINQGLLPIGTRCGAKPESLKLTLVRREQTLDTVQLKPEDLLNQFGVIRVKNPVILRSK